MTGEEIVNILNTYIETYRTDNNINSKSHLVLHRIMTPHETFKVYKKYEFTLWFVDGKNKYTVLKCAIIAKVLQEQEESIIKQVNRRLLLEIFNLMLSEEFDNILKGTYNGTATEKIYRN